MPFPTETAFLPHQPSISSGGHESECSSLYDPNSGPTKESKMCSTPRAENDSTDATYSIESDSSSSSVSSDCTESAYDDNPSAFMPSPKPSTSANEAAFGSASSISVNPDISLYSGAPITVHATLVLILAYILAHNLTKMLQKIC